MNIRNLLVTALRSLDKNKMRSALTSLGIIIGVASVIMMVGIGNSARVAVRDKVYTYGANAMSINSDDPSPSRISSACGHDLISQVYHAHDRSKDGKC